MGFPEADYVVDELKTVLNTDSKIPINHIIWLNDYKFYGDESYVYQDKNKLHELYKDGALCIHDKSILEEASNWCIDNGYAGAFLAAAYDMDTTAVAVLRPLTAMNAILASSTAMNAILASSTAMNAIAASSTAMNAIAASSTAMNAIAASSTAMNNVLESPVFLNALAKQYKNTEKLFVILKAINSSQNYIDKLYETLTNAANLFKSEQIGYFDGVSGADDKATVSAAPNAFLACACGYYSNNSASENIFYDGKELVKNRSGKMQPTSVTKVNVNAFTMAPSTFTENGDGYLAVQKFTAI